MAENLFSDLEAHISTLEESESMLQRLEAFKKMVFKMLDGKKKTVSVDDDMEESHEGVLPVSSGIPTKKSSKAGKFYSVKTPSNKKGHKPVDPAAVRKWTKASGHKQDRNADAIYDIQHGSNKKGHKPVDKKAVDKMNKGKGDGKVGKATPTATLKAEGFKNPLK